MCTQLLAVADWARCGGNTHLQMPLLIEIIIIVIIMIIALKGAI